MRNSPREAVTKISKTFDDGLTASRGNDFSTKGSLSKPEKMYSKYNFDWHETVRDVRCEIVSVKLNVPASSRMNHYRLNKSGFQSLSYHGLDLKS